MTTTSVPKPAAPANRRVLTISIAIIAALVAGFFVFSNLYTDWLWFSQLGFESVLTTGWIWRVVMFLVGFVAMAIPVWLAIQLAYRLRPVYARLSSQLDRYQEVVEPLRRLMMWGIPIFFGFFAGFTASTQWQSAALWMNGTSTSVTDPQFGMDTGFYLFAMPFYIQALAFASAVLLICLAVTAIVSYLYGSIRAGQREGGRWELRISKSARIQIAILAGLYLLVQAVSLWLDRYKTTSESTNNLITGPGYTGVNAVIPGQAILAVIALIVALLFFVTAIIGRWRFPLIGTALLVVSALVVGMGYPWVVNQFQVRPNQFNLESQYIDRNLEATKVAYGIDGLEKTETAAVTDAEPGALQRDAETTASIRIMDPAIISPTVRQLEQFRAYYQFTDRLDVDRYEIDGASQDTVVSVRELNLDALNDSGTWYNRSVVYTHGYGIVVAKGNQRTADGNPVFVERGIPATGFLSAQEFEPRVYFGENSPLYSIVGAPEGSDPIELDYPRGTEGANETKTTFTGDGGPTIGGFFNKLIFSLKFQSTDILLSDAVNDESQILYDRDPLTRVAKVAPYLDLDKDPYPSVVDGEIVWIIDGYTTASTYPYSRTVSLSDAISDTTNRQPQFTVDDINYIRNSVKATVNAYDGSVTLYAWEPEDPILKTWSEVYPTTIKPISEMSGDLMSHVRYPTDLFKVQRAMLGQYHVDDASSFYQGDNRWSTPTDPQDPSSTALQPPYYLTMQMPGQDEPTFSMFTTFIPPGAGTASRNILTGYLAVDANAGAVKGERNDDYGRLRMLEISADTTVPGPGQVQNTFNSDTVVSSQINLLKQGQSEVINGNLLTVPVGGGFLYVQPVFVQASSGTQLPTLQKVLVAFGDDIAFEDTLDEALNSLFGGNSGVDAPDGNTPGATPTQGVTPTPGETTPPVDPGTVDVQRDALLQQAQVALTERNAALAAGDLEAFGVADKKLTEAVTKLLELEAAE